MRTRKSLYIWMGLLIVLCVLLIPYAVKLVGIIFAPKYVSIWKQLGIYQFVALGMVLYLIIRKYLRTNIEWLEVFSHELTHSIVAMLFFRKIHSFQATERDGGIVYTSSYHRFSEIPMALAPYCLPIFTYALLFLRPLIDFDGRWIFDMLIGITLCFHLICFKKQTGNFQPDINQYPLAFSYLYIITAHLINFCIIWVAFFPNYHVFSSFWRMVCAIWGQLLSLFT